jgi:hypothetical protein
VPRVQVVEVDATKPFEPGRDVDDARRCACAKQRKEEIREQKWSEVVHGECHLVAIRTRDPSRDIDAGIVHEHLNGAEPARDFTRGMPDGIERAEIHDEVRQGRVPTLTAKVLDGGGETLRIAPEQHDCRALPSETQCRRLAESAVRTGDEAYASSHRHAGVH